MPTALLKPQELGRATEGKRRKPTIDCSSLILIVVSAAHPLYLVLFSAKSATLLPRERAWGMRLHNESSRAVTPFTSLNPN